MEDAWAEDLLQAARECRASVGGLLDALERDVYSAAERCWRLEDKVVTLRGGAAAVVTLRAKAVCAQEATLLPEEEQQGLATSLDNWRGAVQSAVAAADLQLRVAEQQAVAAVGRALADGAASADALLSLLSTLLSTHDGVAALQHRFLRSTLGLLGRLAVQVAAAWRAAGGASADDLLAAHPSAPQEVVVALNTPAPAPAAGEAAASGDDAAVPPPSTVPAGLDAGAAPAAAGTPTSKAAADAEASLAALRAQQAELLEELSDAADVLRFWSRKSEKAAAGGEGKPGAGREGDTPPMLAEAQQLLWAACHTYEDEQAAADVRTRQLVCQRYKPLDVAALQARADDYTDGQRLLAEQNPTYEPELVELRGAARALALNFLQDKAMVKAGQQLNQLRYLLLEVALTPDNTPAWHRLLVRVAEALLDGSTPPAAVPLLAALLQRGLARQGGEDGEGAAGQRAGGISEQDEVRLVPMILKGMLPPRPGTRPLLREAEAVGLLRSLLRPDAELNAGRLERCYATIKLVLDACSSAGVPAEAAHAALSVFDATRFAVLVCEREAAARADENDAGAGGGVPSMQQLLALARASLAQPGADGTGMALLEGVLTLQPASYLAAALQLALACDTQTERSDVLRMLCRVPTDLLPPAVLGDALIQLTEAIDGNQLAPPFLPYELFGKLYRAQPVMHSLQVAVEQGPAAAAAAAEAAAREAAAARDLWTVRIGGTGDSSAAADDAAAAGGASGSSSALTREAVDGEGAAAAAGSTLMLLPLQASSEFLATLLQRLVGAVLSCLLRRAGAALDAASLSDELLQLLGVLMPAAEEGSWVLQWLWDWLYQEALLPFLADAGAAVEGAGGVDALLSALMSYWISLNWQQATFHAAAPEALATLRLHLITPLSHAAAAVLFRELDFAPVLAKAAPAPRPPSAQRVYSLGDEEEEDGGSDADAAERGAWAAELGLLALHASVLLPKQEHPAWLQQLLLGSPGSQSQRPSAQGQPEGAQDQRLDNVQALMRSPLSAAIMPLVSAAGPNQPLLPHLLAAADWRRLAATMHAEEGAAESGAPWLLLPLLLAPGAVAGQDATAVGGRLVAAAALLSQAAVLARSEGATQCAAGAAGQLLLLSVCQGAKHAPEHRPAAATAAAAAVAAAAEQQERVEVPADFPMELLAGTVEGQQLALLQQQDQERAQLAAQAQLTQEATAGGEGQTAEGHGQQQAEGPELPLVEVRSCWSLTVDQHVALMQQALLPLAASCASLDVVAALQPDDCPAELAAAAQRGGSGHLLEWRAPRLAELQEAASLARQTAGTALGSQAQAGGPAAAAVGLAAVLLPLVRQPITLLTSEQLPFSNSELPLDTEAALFVSVAEGGTPVRQPTRPLRALHQTLTALLPGAEARRRAAQRAEQALHGSVDGHLVQAQLSFAVQAACKQPSGTPLAGCLLRLLYACAALHGSAEALQLSEGLLRFLAAPERDVGPLGRGAPASSAAAGEQPRPTSAASERAELAASAAADELALEVEHADTAPAAAAGSEAASPAGGTQLAATAAQGLPVNALLGLAQGAARLHAALTAALAVERLRQATHVAPKEEFAELATQVLQVAMAADAEPAHPFDLVAVWLAALDWVSDSRWRRLSGGTHTAALLDWVEGLDLRVVALRLAEPEDFGVGDSPAGSPNKLLSAATERLRQVKQHIPGLGREAEAAGPDSAGAAASFPEAGALEAQAGGGKEQKLGSRLRGFLGGKKKEGGSGSSGAAEAAAAPGAQPQEGKRGWGDRMRHRLAKMGIGEEAHAAAVEYEPSPTVTQMGPGEAALPGGRLGPVAEESGASFSEVHHLDAGHLGPGAGGSADAHVQPGGGQAVRRKISGGLQAVGRSLSKVKTKLTPGERQLDAAEELAEHDVDVAIRVGLAAFAVSAYIKSVLCPSLHPRVGGDSTGPGTPVLRSPTDPLGSAPGAGPPRLRSVHHRQSSSRIDAEYLRELDRVLECRSELDSLDTLAGCPLLQLHPGRYQTFLQDAPLMLAAATGVEAFQQRLVAALFGAEPQLRSW